VSVEIKQLENSSVELQFKLSFDDFYESVRKVYSKKSKSISVPGFRQGKVPLKMVESYYGENVFYEDAMNNIFPIVYEDAIKKFELSPVGDPELKIVQLERDKDFVFSIMTAVKPEVILPEYKGIKCQRTEYFASESDIESSVEDTLKEIQLQNARVITLDSESDYDIKSGDVAIIDYEGKIENKLFEGSHGIGFELEIGSSTFIDGFEDKLIGCKVGDHLEFDLKFPDDYFNVDLSGKNANFIVDVRGIKYKELAEIDDEFAKDVSEFENLEEFKVQIRNNIKEGMKGRSESEFSDEAVRLVVEGTKIDFPECMIREEFGNILKEFDGRLQQRNYSVDYYLKAKKLTIDDFYEQQRKNSERRLKLRLTLLEIAKAENVVAEPERIEKEYEKMAEFLRSDICQTKKMIDVETIKRSICISEGIKAIVDNAVVTEIIQKNMLDKDEKDEKVEKIDKDEKS